VIIQSLLEILLLIAITSDVSRGITGQLKETVTVLRHHHQSLLKGTELLLLHLHDALKNVVVPEALTELDPGEKVAVLSRVGLPPVKSGASQLPCCVQDPLTVVALSNNQLALHRTKPVIRLEWIRGVREGWRMTSQEIRTPIMGLRWRWRWGLSVDMLQSLNSVIQGRHHLHLELEELLRG
jgi:hypothetical protein